MKKLLLLFLLTFSFLIHAAPIDVVRARRVASSFLAYFAAGNNPISATVPLILQNDPQKDGFYFFVPTGRVGFIMISADDAALPVLGYSLDNTFPLQQAPVQVKKWIENYSDQIEYIQANHITADATVRQEWFRIEYAEHNNNITTKTTAVAPLIATTWDQGDYYNALCPYDASEGERVVTGCVATAMAQIIKYHNSPSRGTGFHSYSHPTYGTLSANFGNTTYNWGSMPNNVTSSNNAVATLMYHCGVSVDMNYGVASSGGSGAYPNAIPVALVNYFGFKNTASIANRASYSEASWIALLKSELDASRPVEYHGFGNGGGHSFVCDGYDNTNKFHYNWGWSGLANGYYNVNALNPTDLGYGGGLGSYNSNQGIVKGIQPNSSGGGGGTYSLSLHSNPALNNSTITYLDGVTLSVEIQNTGTADFTGDLAAAIFNSTGVFVEYIEVRNGTLDNAGYYDVDFTTASVANARPGDYSIYIYSRPTGGNWSLIAGGSYTNYASLTVEAEASTSGLELASDIAPVVVIRNQNLSISTSIKNNDASAFSGYVSLDLYTLDGGYLGAIDEQSFSVSAGATKSVTFTSSGITENPGDYIVAVWTSPDYINWEMAGSALYENPVYLLVKEAAPSEDAYENNDSSEVAYTLTPFATGEYDTDGSNLHIGSDLDFYKVSLPTGMDYSIDARIHDSYNSGNGNSYSADVMFSYDTGTGLSDSYDDVLPNYIHVYGGGEVEFLVAPYFAGEVGSYLLGMTIYEGIVDNTKDPLWQSRIIRFYPNPTSGSVTFDLPASHHYSEIRVYNAQGVQVFTTSEVTGMLSLGHLTAGIYSIELLKENGVSDHAKVSVQK